MSAASDPIDVNRIYTVPEAAQIARISPRTYYAAAARGEVPAVRVGRTLRVSGAALATFLGQGVIATTGSHDGNGQR